MNPMKADDSEAHRDYVLKMLKLHDYAHGLSTSLEDLRCSFSSTQLLRAVMS